MEDLIICMIGGENVDGVGTLLSNADDSIDDLLGRLHVRGDIYKDYVRIILLQVQARS